MPPMMAAAHQVGSLFLNEQGQWAAKELCERQEARM
jgi:hypothetical protein